MRVPHSITTRLAAWARRVALSRDPDFAVRVQGGIYLRRWWVIRTQVFGIYIHFFEKSDDERALHDHPWPNASLVLSGAYDEVVQRSAGQIVKRRYEGAVVCRRATAAHRIQLLAVASSGYEIPCWTLFFTGPRVRDWGFLCPQGWRPWRVFCDGFDRNGKEGRGCE